MAAEGTTRVLDHPTRSTTTCRAAVVEGNFNIPNSYAMLSRCGGPGMEAFARFLDSFEVPDAGPGTLLDRGLVYGCSEYGEGYKHGVAEMPVVFAGGACGAMRRGVHTREEGGNIVKAHVNSLRALGIDTPSFGFNGGETTEAIGGFLS